jgi:predicted nuclease of predicted toxin-antitoxin system
MKKKLLLDENLPHPLKAVFDDSMFELTSVHDMGWATLKNGHLLAAMTEAGIEYLLTADKSLQFQQNLDKYPVKLVLVRTYDNRFKTLKELVPKIEQGLNEIPTDAKIWEIDLRG